MNILIVLLTALIQVAHCGSKCVSREVWDRTNHGQDKPYMLNDCHRVIDGLNYVPFDTTINTTGVSVNQFGYITMQVGSNFTLNEGVCKGAVINNSTTPIQIYEATLAWEMTAYLFNPCIANGLFGEFSDQNKTVWLGPNWDNQTSSSQYKPGS